MVSDNKDILKYKSEIIDLVKSRNNNFINLVSELIGDNWIGTSLKTYKEDACQITTDYSYRTWLEKEIGDKSTEDSIKLNEFFNFLNKHDNDRFTIIALNTYENSQVYTLRELTFDKVFDKIDYKINKKLSQYNLIKNNKCYFKVLYGKNQANAFQRGIWTYSKSGVEYFPIIVKGNYEINDYFDRIVISTII